MIADPYTQLVAHVFAHVRLSGPGDLFDPDWVAQTRALPDSDRLVEDAALLGRLWADGDAGVRVMHALLDLHTDSPAFLATTGRPLAELDAADVASARALNRLRSSPHAELVHATLSLQARAFMAWWQTRRPEFERLAASVRRQLERVAQHVPTLADHRVEIVAALGVHGRASPERILVGRGDPTRLAILAAHEACVLAHPELDYVAGEWLALVALAHALRSSPPKLRAAHDDWLATLELGPLLDALGPSPELDALRPRARGRAALLLNRRPEPPGLPRPPGA